MSKENNQRSQCAIANALEILGDRWTLLIIRDLMFTNRREFGHFLNAGEGISTNILSERLERLLSRGLIDKKPHPNHGKKYLYVLTEAGLQLAPTLIEFTLWSIEHIDNTFAPPEVLEMMTNDRQKLLELIYRRECLVTLEL